MGVAFVTCSVLVSITLSRPQVGAVVFVPAQLLLGAVGGVPATYNLLPRITPYVAAGTAMGVPRVGLEGFVTFRGTTLEVVPPHSGPQFSTYAVLLSALNTPQTGWSNPLVK